MITSVWNGYITGSLSPSFSTPPSPLEFLSLNKNLLSHSLSLTHKPYNFTHCPMVLISSVNNAQACTHTHTHTHTHTRTHARIHTYAIHPWNLVFTVGCFGHRGFRLGEHRGKVPFWLSMESKNRQSENKYNEPSANRWLCWSYGWPGKAISRQKQRLIWRGVGSTTEVTYVWRGRVLLRQKSCHPPS